MSKRRTYYDPATDPYRRRMEETGAAKVAKETRQQRRALARARSRCTCRMHSAPGSECPVHGEAP